MTLVLSDLSRHGIIMLGDSAVIRRASGVDINSPDKAEKIQYFRKANIGAGIWGVRSIGAEKSDEILARFALERDSMDLGLERCGQELARIFNDLLDKAGLEGKAREGGIHLGGYVEGHPKLWHVHWSATGVDGPWALAKDFPESKGWSDERMDGIIRSGGSVQIANGFYHYLNLARFCLRMYSKLLRLYKGHEFPANSIDGRITYVRTLFLLVPAALKSPNSPVYVDENIRLVSFDHSGCIKGPLKIRLAEDSNES
jgi:hypothetical protein